MKLIHWNHKKVRPDGILITSDGQKIPLGIVPKIIRSPDDGGCGCKDCDCEKMWAISINYGYNKKKSSVNGLTIIFDNQAEFMNFTISGTPAFEKIAKVSELN